MGRLPSRSNLAPGVFHPCVPRKQHVASKGLATDTDVTQAVTSWLQTSDTDLFYAGIQALVLRLETVLPSPIRPTSLLVKAGAPSVVNDAFMNGSIH